MPTWPEVSPTPRIRTRFRFFARSRSRTPADGTTKIARVELVSSPPFLRSKSWTIDRLAPGEHPPLGDRKIDLDADYLAGLNEAERGEITLPPLCRRHASGRAAFSGPAARARRMGRRGRHGAVAAGFRDAERSGGRQGPARGRRATGGAWPSLAASTAIRSGDPQRAYMLAAAIYSAIAGMALHYAEPPASFESAARRSGGPRRSPRTGWQPASTPPFCSPRRLEAAGLYPVVLLFDGHAAVGVWLIKRTLPQCDRDRSDGDPQGARLARVDRLRDDRRHASAGHDVGAARSAARSNRA